MDAVFTIPDILTDAEHAWHIRRMERMSIWWNIVLLRGYDQMKAVVLLNFLIWRGPALVLIAPLLNRLTLSAPLPQRRCSPPSRFRTVGSTQSGHPRFCLRHKPSIWQLFFYPYLSLGFLKHIPDFISLFSCCHTVILNAAIRIFSSF